MTQTVSNELRSLRERPAGIDVGPDDGDGPGPRRHLPGRMSDQDPADGPEPAPPLRWFCCAGTVAHCWCPHRPPAPDDERDG